MPTRSRPPPLRVGPVLAEHRDAHHDEPGVEVGRADVPLLERAGTEVLHDDVGGGREAAEQVLTLGLAQVEGDALAAPALHRPEQRVARPTAVSPSVASAAFAGVTNGPMSRMKSPRPGCSILMTSAPCSPSRPAQKGAAMRVPRSRTRTPASGPLTWRNRRPAPASPRPCRPPCAPRARRSRWRWLETNWWTMKWYFQASRWPIVSSVWLIVVLDRLGGDRRRPARPCRPSRGRRRRARSRGTTLLTSPKRSASAAVSVSAHHRNSLALRGPSSHGSTRISTPTPVMRATGLENFVSSAATIRSHMQASIEPGGRDGAVHRGDRGLAEVAQAEGLVPVHDLLVAQLALGRGRASAAHSSAPLRISLRSCPAEKCLPAPARTTTRTSSSASASVERGVDLVDHPRALRVRGVGTVERQRRDVPVDLVGDGLEVHRRIMPGTLAVAR